MHAQAKRKRDALPTLDEFIGKLILRRGAPLARYNEALGFLVRFRDDIPEANRKRLISAMRNIGRDFEQFAKQIEGGNYDRCIDRHPTRAPHSQSAES